MNFHKFINKAKESKAFTSNVRDDIVEKIIQLKIENNYKILLLMGIGVFKNDIDYVLNKFWVNFQKQHEFNPIHNHSGVYSFVVFMKIPTDWREQHEIPFVKDSNAPKASDFEFVYTDVMGNVTGYTYSLDSSFEVIMLFFPAEMMHQVYPFYNCEEERITISGNIVYDI